MKDVSITQYNMDNIDYIHKFFKYVAYISLLLTISGCAAYLANYYNIIHLST